MQSKKIASYFSCMPSQEWLDVLIVPDAPEVITEAGDSPAVQHPFDLQRVFFGCAFYESCIPNSTFHSQMQNCIIAVNVICYFTF